MLKSRKITVRLDVASSTFFASVAISKTIAEIGWQVATVRFILDPLSPLRGRNIEFRRVLGNGSIGSIRTLSPRALPLYTMFLTSHRQRDANSTWKSARCVLPHRQWGPHTRAFSRARACVRTCVREGWQSRREISYEITGSHCRGRPPRPPSTSAGSIINL